MTISDPLAAPAPAVPEMPGPLAPDAPSVPAPAAAVPAPPVPPAPAVTPGPSPAGHAPSAAGPRSGRRSLDVLANVEMTVTVELGRTRMPVRQLLSLSAGSVIELNRSANTPVDVFVNGTLFARGEVVVIDDEFGVRITDIVERDGDEAPERA